MIHWTISLGDAGTKITTSNCCVHWRIWALTTLTTQLQENQDCKHRRTSTKQLYINAKNAKTSHPIKCVWL